VRPIVAIGVDGARTGWVGACLRSAPSLSPSTWETEVRLFPDFQAVVTFAAKHGSTLAIDIPIGLPDQVEPRACDIAARKLLPGRASCVFNPPSRDLLASEGDYPTVQRLVAEKRETDPEARGLTRHEPAAQVEAPTGIEPV
jgi:predicted RNase H-like nuclease